MMSNLIGLLIKLFISQRSIGVRDSNGLRRQKSLTGELFMNPELRFRLRVALSSRRHGRLVFRPREKAQPFVIAIGMRGHIDENTVVVLCSGSQLFGANFG